MNKKINISNPLQRKYSYNLTEPVGKNFDPRFCPDLSPKQMLTLGIFDGKYFSKITNEFPKNWFTNTKITKKEADVDLNYFKIHASQPLSVWQKKGWIYKDDPHGWFEWYCRYYMGRRIEKEDDRQIKRWVAMRRHIGQINKNCRVGDLFCRKRQRQALLHWAYDSRKF